jgi:hypothetical protein
VNALIVLAPFVGGAAAFALALWLERATRRPGLSFGIGGVALICVAVLGLSSGSLLLPVLFLVQGIGFLYHARWRRAITRAERAGPSQSDARG